MAFTHKVSIVFVVMFLLSYSKLNGSNFIYVCKLQVFSFGNETDIEAQGSFDNLSIVASQDRAFNVNSADSLQSDTLFATGRIVASDGHPFVYLFDSSVVIGNQIWMSRNLHVFKFRNGDPIPIAKSESEWQYFGENRQPACCYYQNNGAVGSQMGLLYNWYAINDSRGLAPSGWRLPYVSDLVNLVDNFGGKFGNFNALKGTISWNGFSENVKCGHCSNWPPEKIAGQTCPVCRDSRQTMVSKTGSGSDNFGFNALASGFRTDYGYFDSMNEKCIWWLMNESNHHNALAFGLSFNANPIDFLISDKSFGYSVRCINDAMPMNPNLGLDYLYGITTKETPIEAVVETIPGIFNIVDEMPSFPGGEGNLVQYLSDNIKYPALARENGIKGTVFLTFQVGTNGKVSEVKILRGIGGGCDEEAVRVVRNMPAWRPGKMDGKLVIVQCNLPIQFSLK